MAKRKTRGEVVSELSGTELAFALWGRGNLKAARLLAKSLLAAPISAAEQQDLARLLADTGPDPRAVQVAAFAGAVVLLVIVLTKFFG